MGGCVLKVDRIVLRKNREILSGVSFELAHASRITLLGPSGSGKSSLLRCLNRLETIDSGTVTLEGKDIRGLDPVALRRQVGLLFQVPALLPRTVEENIELGPKLRRQKLNPETLQSLVQEVGLQGVPLDRTVGTLSVGEQQRVALAQVLANDPKVLLLDEPTSALDPTAVGIIETAIATIHNKKNTPVLWVTHDVAQAVRFDASTLVLVDGRILAQGPIRELMAQESNPALTSFFQGKFTTPS